ncbi:MAG TPA: hypothetical protein VI391_03770 [Thermoanaerobaculia bacterium]
MLFLLAALLVQPRPRAVMIYPVERAWFHRLFHTAHQRALQHELSARFDLDVHDRVATAGALFAIDVRGAEVLVISGHGCPFAISMGNRAERTIDSSDFARLQAFFSGLAPDATIILQSCDTGLGFAWIVKRAAGPNRHVIAAMGEVPRDGLRITSLDPLNVTITCERGDDCTLRL